VPPAAVEGSNLWNAGNHLQYQNTKQYHNTDSRVRIYTCIYNFDNQGNLSKGLRHSTINSQIPAVYGKSCSVT
jgi:hypothetical protein